jgi:hypothetical protein
MAVSCRGGGGEHLELIVKIHPPEKTFEITHENMFGKQPT